MNFQKLERAGARFHRHNLNPGEEMLNDNWWNEGLTNSISGPTMKGKGTGGSDSQVWVHLHNTKSELTLDEVRIKVGASQAFLFPYITEIRPTNPQLDSREPGIFGFLVHVQSDRPYMTEIY